MKKLICSALTAILSTMGAARAATPVVSFPFGQNTDTQRSGAIIEIQEDNRAALLFGDTYRSQSIVFFWLKNEQFAGKTLRFTVMAKGIGLSSNFLFGLQANKDGKTVWPGGVGASGTFDWRPFSFTADFAKLGVGGVAVRLGLQNTKGMVLFRDLRVEEAEAARREIPQGPILAIDFDKGTQTQGSGAAVQVQEDEQPALVFGNTYRPQSMMYFWLTEEQCADRTLRFSVMAKGIGLSNSFIFGLQANKGGKPIWPGGAGGSGTFDWKPFSFTADFPKLGIRSAALRIGLQNTQGRVMFRNLRVEVVGTESAEEKEQEPSYSGRYGSVDFSPNRFHVPDFHACRNLVQNPSFEDGTDFWVPTGLSGQNDAMKPDGSRLLELDDTTAADGRCSLRQEVIEGAACPPATFAIPLEEGAEYTLSFHAKTDSPGQAKFSVGGMTDVWDTFLNPVRYRVGTNWRRYTYTFKSPGKMVQLHLGCTRGAPPCRVWIDAVQLEKGNQATPFARLPASVALRGNTPDNVSEPGTPAGIGLLANRQYPGKGTLRYMVRDFFGTERASGALPFETSAPDVPVELPLPACDTLPSGEYVVETRIELPDGFAHSSWHRFARMAAMDGTHKHRMQFSAAGIHTLAGDWETVIQLFQRMGIGSTCIFSTPPEQYQALLRKHGIQYYTMLFRYEGWPPRILGKYSLNATASRGGKNGVLAIPDEDIPLLVKHALQTVASNPDCKAFKTINEPFCHTEEEIARTVQILKTVRAAVRKAHPDVKIMTPDCANIDHAMSYLETFFRHGGADACDIVAVHLYRGHPDGMDADVTKLLGLIDRYKPGAELWSTEGGYFNTYVIPDLRFPVVSHGGDHYRTGNMSYDLGLGERIATAYETRYRIQALKHAERLKVDQDWNLTANWRTYFGMEAVPTATVFAVNTLARLLGGADFVADLKLPKELRGYLFADEQNRPVAALWFTNGDNLYSDLPPAMLDASSLGAFEAFDTMCAPLAAKDGKLAVPGYPIFVRGKPGTADALRQAIEAATFAFPEHGPALGFTFGLEADGAFRPAFSNRFNRPLAGSLVCRSSSKTLLEDQLELKPYEVFQPAFSLPAASAELSGMSFNYTFRPADGTALERSMKLQYATVRKVDRDTFRPDGNPAKWDGIPGLRADNLRRSAKDNDPTADFDVETKWAWNEDFLYVAVFVKDNDFSPSMTIQFPDMGDSVTLFFDSFADNMRGVRSGESGTGEDDHDYLTWFAKDGSVRMIRRRCAHWQLSFSKPGTVPGVTGTHARTDGGYWMELAIPMGQVKPVELKDGGCFCANVRVNDYDGGKQTGNAYYGEGEPPVSWRAPQDYLFLFLEPSGKR